MQSENNHNFAHWSNDDLQKAETTATKFLEDNGTQIAATLTAKVQFVEILIQRLSSRKTTLDQRLDCFARIGEIAELLKEDANGFFELASQPVVARILANAEKR